MDAWFDEFIAVPFRELLGLLAVGEVLQDLARCRALAIGIEGLFRTQAAQYYGWPSGSTTDGTIIEFCIRRDAAFIDVAGKTWLDFTGDVFPCRAHLRSESDGSTSVVVLIGMTNPLTGAPTKLPPGSFVLLASDADGRNVEPELILNRRQAPIPWTRAFAARSEPLPDSHD